MPTFSAHILSSLSKAIPAETHKQKQNEKKYRQADSGKTEKSVRAKYFAADEKVDEKISEKKQVNEQKPKQT